MAVILARPFCWGDTSRIDLGAHPEATFIATDPLRVPTFFEGPPAKPESFQRCPFRIKDDHHRMRSGPWHAAVSIEQNALGNLNLTILGGDRHQTRRCVSGSDAVAWSLC